MKTVYFVCSGNTCRSPMAEGMMRKILEDNGITDVEVKSCGTDANEGSSPFENAVIAAKEYGIDITGHKAVNFDTEFVTSSSVFVCMEYYHMLILVDKVPKDQLFVLGSGIFDPYGCDLETYRRCAKQIYDSLPYMIGILGIKIDWKKYEQRK